MYYDTEMSPLVPKLSTVARMRPRSWWKLGLTLEVANKNHLLFVKQAIFRQDFSGGCRGSAQLRGEG